MEPTVGGLNLEGDKGKTEYQLNWLFFFLPPCSLCVIILIAPYLAHR